ncbi:MAG TPA: tripartite tricarboxylate transporter TctB family protein [Burkholderiales bacterium]|nr:tripartite tricarboxylate transporter TctB family protein [Burkholderiales bacterium]
MKIPLHDNKNFLSGLFFIGTGGLGIFMAQDYPMGTALRMGPGYFPIVLSAMLILFGIYCLIQGLLKPEKLPGNWSVRALLILPVATVVFGILMEHGGFIPALIALVFISAFASNEFKFTEVLMLAIGLTIGSWALFIWGLGLPYPLITGY